MKNKMSKLKFKKMLLKLEFMAHLNNKKENLLLTPHQTIFKLGIYLQSQ